jgi:hypothetical protein
MRFPFCGLGRAVPKAPPQNVRRQAEHFFLPEPGPYFLKYLSVILATGTPLRKKPDRCFKDLL